MRIVAVCTLLWKYTRSTSDGGNVGKRIRDAALYTFVHHYTFAAKSKTLII